MSKKPTINELEQQIAELTEALQRERADVTNVRRQHEDQLSNLKDMVKGSVVRQLLPVIDNFERALKHIPKDLEKNDYVTGVGKIVKQFEDTLKQIGVERIKTVGEVFDPRLHEAVQMEEGVGNTEVVCEELQSGYALGDEILRHAMVKVKMKASK